MKYILNLLSVLCLAIWTSCSTNHELEDFPYDGDAAKSSTISFTLDGKNCSLKSRSRKNEIQHPEEKNINSLYAVIFKSTSNSFIPGETLEANTDTFYAIEEVRSTTGDIPQDGDINLMFRLGAEGNCVVSFVANPNEALLNSLQQNLKGKTVAAFKAIVTNENPDNENKLMVSEKFHSFSVKFNENAEIVESVRMKRAMARIDVKNACPGITVNKIVFNNRMDKTVVIADSPEFNAELMSNQTVYENLNLEGNQNNPSLKSLFSYEHFGSEQSIPSLDIYYTANKVKYKATVVLKKQDGQPIMLKRNTLYVVNLKNESGNINFNIEVADWNNGEIFEITSNDLINGIVANENNDLSDVTKGIFMLKDGNLISAQKLTAKDYANVIGVVVSLDKTKLGAAAIKFLGGIDKAHGLVMSLKNIEGKHKFGGFEIEYYGDYNKITDLLYKDFDGLATTETILNHQQKNDFPAFCKLEEFRKINPTPDGTTQWFIAAEGQWVEMLEKFGCADCNQIRKDSEQTFSSIPAPAGKNAITTINKMLKAIPSQYKDEFTINDQFWTSSGCSNRHHSRAIHFNDGKLEVKRDSRNYDSNVRCFFAF